MSQNHKYYKCLKIYFNKYNTVRLAYIDPVSWAIFQEIKWNLIADIYRGLSGWFFSYKTYTAFWQVTFIGFSFAKKYSEKKN
jgi:hypothetical protein